MEQLNRKGQIKCKHCRDGWHYRKFDQCYHCGIDKGIIKEELKTGCTQHKDKFNIFCVACKAVEQ